MPRELTDQAKPPPRRHSSPALKIPRNPVPQELDLEHREVFAIAEERVSKNVEMSKHGFRTKSFVPFPTGLLHRLVPPTCFSLSVVLISRSLSSISSSLCENAKSTRVVLNNGSGITSGVTSRSTTRGTSTEEASCLYRASPGIANSL